MDERSYHTSVVAGKVLVGITGSNSNVEVASRTQPVGLGRTLGMPRIVQPLGAAIVVKVFAFLVEGCSWIGRVAKHERLVVGILTYPRPELFGHVTIRAADIEDAKSILLNTPKREI